MAIWPTPPEPIVTTVDPASVKGAIRRTACIAVRPASACGASGAGSVPSGNGTSARALVRNSSAYPPGQPSTPGKRHDGQCMSLPDRQAGQCPQVTAGWTMTGSPTARWVTAGPTSCTQPLFSWPRVSGRVGWNASSSSPCRMCTSVRHTPAPAMRTMTSCGSRTVGSATSVMETGLPYASTWAERIRSLPSGNRFPAIVLSSRSAVKG